MLLCDYRYNFKANLSRVLRKAFAYDREESSSEDGLLFSGCYLVATGERVRQELGWQTELDDLSTIVSHALAWERHLTSPNAR